MENKILGLGKKVKIKKIKASSGCEQLLDIIPDEIQLSIFLNKNLISIVSCSPESEIQLAIGYLLSGGYLDKYSDIDTIFYCDDEKYNIENKKKDSRNGKNTGNDRFPFSRRIEVSCNTVDEDVIRARKVKFISPDCNSISDFISIEKLEKIKSSIEFDPKIILKLNKEVLSYQKYKKEFGGLHSGALFSKSGDVIKIIEDIGRNNCIDKIIGYSMMNNISLEDKIFFTTGRISLGIIFKIYRMSIPVVVTNSSVTYSSVTVAEKLNLAVVGYARGNRFNVYSCPWRIIK
ncbi:MAG: formate dehydrogenase accessory sulfurtransferase FdhD [Actinobacteria bacterium]|nr:formate dehydrogenase accessory sulfurtransferase FdhD [Actinomycetota bacterium]MBL7060628.1 formate dehydrogenase accessory sulfurtransferase FdhD [Actinomycetota bacterium]